jgi:hypothetical protein
MNYFEYTVEVEVTDDIEKKTKQLFDMIKDGRNPFYLQKFTDNKIDEDENKTKTIRTFILTSSSNINHIILHYFSGNCAKFHCFYKTHVMMF